MVNLCIKLNVLKRGFPKTDSPEIRDSKFQCPKKRVTLNLRVYFTGYILKEQSEMMLRQTETSVSGAFWGRKGYCLNLDSRDILVRYHGNPGLKAA